MTCSECGREVVRRDNDDGADVCDDCHRDYLRREVPEAFSYGPGEDWDEDEEG
jgi:DNA-directed RNA polymerase subunit RPC12/RpoP